MKKKDIQFKKNFIWNIIGTGLNAFNSLLFLIIVTRINGVDDAGIFTISYSTGCILYMLGIYAGRIYQVTENNELIKDKDYIFHRIITCVCIILIGIIFTIIKNYNLYKSSICILLIIYKAIEAFSDVFYGILQKNELLEKVGKSFFIKAISSIIIFVILDALTRNMLLSILTIVIINIIITVCYDFHNVKEFLIINEKIERKNIIKIFKNGFFTFMISFLGVYMSSAQKYAIDNYLTENIQAIFGIIIMPATVMGLLAQFLIHPFLNKIFNSYKENNYEKIKKILYKIILCIFIIGILFSICGYLIGTEALGIVYGINLECYKMSLLLILIAATLYTMAWIISPILITMRYTFIQFIIYIIIAVFEGILSNVLVSRFGFDGAIYAYLITMILYFILFYSVSMIIINNKLKKQNFI